MAGISLPGLAPVLRQLARWARDPVLGVAVLAFAAIIAAGLGAPWLVHHDPTQIDFAAKLSPPGAVYWFGTDELGRDIFAQVLFGARTSLSIAAGVVLLSLALGLAGGAVAGHFGGVADSVIMRIADIFLAFPPLLLPIAICAALGPSLVNMVVAIAVSWFPWYARIARAAVIRVRGELYVKAARAMGVPEWRILLRHCLPNALAPIVVQASLDFGYAILTAASLSFIGLGARPPVFEWGLMVAMSRGKFLDYWWTAAFPGLAIFVTVLAVNLIGDGVRDALDPRAGGRR